MDRAIEPNFRIKKIIQRVLFSCAMISSICALFIWGPDWIRPGVSRSRIRTARVDLGSIEATITASGTVVPEFEQVLSSPINTRVVKILKKPGAVLKKGEPIIELDMSESILAVEKMNQQIELKQNQQAKVKLDLESTLNNLQSQWEIKNLEFKSLKSISARNQGLMKQGLMSEDLLKQSELNEEKARLELKQLEAAKQNAMQSTNTQLEGLVLELKTLMKERDEAQRQLDLATSKSDRDGVLTWVVSEEGASVQKGAVLARIADLNSFRIEATISDIYASKLSAGLPVSAKINDEYLEGAINTILPTIKDGAITLVIGLKEKSSRLLKSNLRVDVLIVTERKEKALRIKRGPFANSEGTHNVFVIRDNVAIKTPVQIGISNFDNYEVVQGLLEGDEVIISDMSDYMHMKEVKIK